MSLEIAITLFMIELFNLLAMKFVTDENLKLLHYLLAWFIPILALVLYLPELAYVWGILSSAVLAYIVIKLIKRSLTW